MMLLRKRGNVTNRQRRATRTYESNVLAIVLIGINAVCIALEILIVVVFDCNACRRCRSERNGGASGSSTGVAGKQSKKKLTQVRPILIVSQENEDAAQRAWE